MGIASNSHVDLENVAEALLRDGFAVIDSNISNSDVSRARSSCEEFLLNDPDAETEIEASALLERPELASIIFNERTINILTGLLGGTLTYYPNYVARLNRFTNWHIDNSCLPNYHKDSRHLYEPEFRHLQCVVYLQDNVPGAGGGLDVRVGSHRWGFEGSAPDYDELSRVYPDVISVNSRAGDLIMFDGRLMHRGTPTDGTIEQRKYGIFWSASRNDPVQVRRFLDYLAGRKEFLLSLNPSAEFEYVLRRYDNVRNIRFPASYLPQTVQLIREHAISAAEI